MKKWIVLPVIILFVSCGVKTPYDNFRKENKNDIMLSFGISNFVARNFVMNEELRKMTKGISGIQKYRVLISESSSNGFEPKLNYFLDQNHFEELLKVSESKQKVSVYTYQQEGVTKEIILKVFNGNDLVVISAKGKELKINDLKNFSL